METKSTSSSGDKFLGSVWPENSITSKVSLMNSQFIQAYSTLRLALARVEEIASQSFYSSQSNSFTRVVEKFQVVKNLNDQQVGRVLDFMISGSPNKVTAAKSIDSSSNAEDIVGYIITCLNYVRTCFAESVKAEDAKNLQYILSASSDSLDGLMSVLRNFTGYGETFRFLYALQKCSILKLTPRIYEDLRNFINRCKDEYDEPKLDILIWLLSWADSEHDKKDYMACFVLAYTIHQLYSLRSASIPQLEFGICQIIGSIDDEQLMFIKSLLIFINDINDYMPMSTALDAELFLSDQLRIWSLLAVARLLRSSRERVINLLSKASTPVIDPSLFSTFSQGFLV